MAIRAKDNEIFIEFAAKGNNPVRLKLVNDNRLEGTIKIVLNAPSTGEFGLTR